MKLTLSDLVKCGALQGVEKKKHYAIIRDDGAACRTVKGWKMKGHNDCRDTLYSQELDLGKLFDVEKLFMLMTKVSEEKYYGHAFTFNYMIDEIAKAICDKANELVKEEK